jgi:rubrerythrin
MTEMSYQEQTEFPSQAGSPNVAWWSTEVSEPEFMRNFKPTDWEYQALTHIQDHILAERGAASSYEELGKAEDPQVRYLASMVAADEHRHHQLLQDIVQSLGSRMYEGADDSVIAEAAPLSPERRQALLEITRRMLVFEEDDTRELKRLRRELHKAPDDTMWPLLIDIMELDTEKHFRILKAIERHLTKEKWE